VFWIELVLIVPLTVLTVILVAAAFLAKRSAAKKAGAHLIKDAGGETPPLGKVKRESMLSGKKRASSLSGKVTPARPFSIKPKDSS
jgi:hypothetical protein